MKNLTSYLVTFVVALVAIAVVWRVAPLKKIVLG